MSNFSKYKFFSLDSNRTCVANTGISAVIDSYGRVIGRLGLNEQGVVDTGLPRGLSVLTLYYRFGDWPILIIVALSFLLIVFQRRSL